MNAPHDISVTKQLAAPGRFFYDLGAAETVSTAAEDYAFNANFHQTYSRYLRHPLSQIVGCSLNANAAWLSLAFDTTWHDQGILGWQLSITDAATDLTGSVYGRRQFVQYTAPTESVAAGRRFDNQGRALSDLLVKSGDRAVSPGAIRVFLETFMPKVELTKQCRDWEIKKQKIAADIIKIIKDNPDDTLPAAKLRSLQVKSDNIGFAAADRRLRLVQPFAPLAQLLQ